MDRSERQKRAYDFLQAHIDEIITATDLAGAADWKPGAASTYISKHLKGLVEAVGRGQYRVRREFRRLSFEEYRRLADQTRRIFQSYDRDEYEAVVTFQFLLPLTREEELRRSLDDLFYEDAVQRLLEEAGPARFEEWIAREPNSEDSAYLETLVREAGRRFAGYSVSHVSGRFRAADTLLSREAAAEWFKREQRYLIDETTAIALFIVPLGRSRSESEAHRAQLPLFEDGAADATNGLSIDEELGLVRELFFSLFVEALIRYVTGEDQIWLIEDGPAGRRLHVWSPQ